jgi:hypothetical protein
VTRPLLVAVAHGMDLVSFLAVASALGAAGESNPFMRSLYLNGSLLSLVALKAAGATALALIAQMRPWALVPAAGAGLAGAAVNSLAVSMGGTP